MADRFNEAVELLKQSGISDLVQQRSLTAREYEVRGPLPVSRGKNVTGAALLLRRPVTAAADPYEFYTGKQSAIYAEPGRKLEITVRSSAEPIVVEKPKKGGWIRVRGKVGDIAEEALKKTPADYHWYEGMVGEETNLK